MCSAFQKSGFLDRLACESGTSSSSTNCPAPTGLVASASGSAAMAVGLTIIPVLPDKQQRDLVVGLVEDDPHVERAVHDDVLDDGQLGGDGRLLVVTTPQQARAHGLGVQRRAVGEHEAVAQVERDLVARGVVVPRLGEARRRIAVGRLLGDRLVDERQGVRVVADGRRHRIPRRRQRPAPRQRAAGLRRPLVAGRGRRRHRGAGGGRLRRLGRRVSSSVAVRIATRGDENGDGENGDRRPYDG